MTLRHLTIDRIALTMEGLPLDQAQLVAAQLEAALSAQAGWGRGAAGDLGASASTTLETGLTGPALVQAVAARLAELAGLGAMTAATPQDLEGQAGDNATMPPEERDPPDGASRQEFMPWP